MLHLTVLVVFLHSCSKCNFLLWLRMTWHHAADTLTERCMTGTAVLVCKHNTSGSSFSFCICQSTQPMCLHLHNKRKRQTPWTKRKKSDKTVVLIVARGQQGRKCKRCKLCGAGMEWNSLSHSCNGRSRQHMTSLVQTLVSHKPTSAVCVCVWE